MGKVYNRDTLDYIDCLLFDRKPGRCKVSKGRAVFLCGDMTLEATTKSVAIPAGGHFSEITLVEAPDTNEAGVFFLLSDGTHFMLSFITDTKVSFALKAGAIV